MNDKIRNGPGQPQKVAPVTVPAVTLTLARFTEEDRAEWLAAAVAVLSEAERQHVAATSAADVGTQYAIGRAMIRLLAAQASGRPPRLVKVTVSDAGKPLLDDVPDLHVSVAHTGRVVVAAACPHIAVGVDIERATPATPHLRRVVARLFSESEAASVRDLPDAEFSDWFWSAWTVKEAVGKALGVGIVPALSGVVVSGAVVSGHSEGTAMTGVWSGPPADQWTVHQLSAPDGDEKISVALPAPGIALEPVSCLTVDELTRRSTTLPG